MAASAVRGQRSIALQGLHTSAAGLALPITALGAALRLYQVSANGFNTDEVWSIWMASQTPGDLVRTILLDHGDNTPPTYYLLLQLFTQFGQDPLVIRALSVLAGAAAVWLTYRLAAILFDWRVASLSAFLLAVSPLHIQFSQLARAYVLADLWALFSLYFFARIVLGPGQTRHWVGWALASIAGFATFYLTLLVLLVENGAVAFLWLRRGARGGMLRRWLISQVVVLSIALVAVVPVLLTIVNPVPGRGLTWIDRPNFLSLVKTAILFTTGDPSYGPTGITLTRLVGLGIAVALGLLAVWVYWRGRVEHERNGVLLLGSAVLVPLLAVFLVSQWRPMYGEKYLLFALPPLLIVYSWAIIRSGTTLVAGLAVVVLVLITGRSLFVYYSAPVGEQWREAIAYLRPQYRQSDIIVISPGFYMRPFAYYFYGAFPPDTRAVSHSPVVLVQDARFQPSAGGERLLGDDVQPGQRIWLVTGFGAPDSGVGTLAEHGFETAGGSDFLGAHVRLLQPTPGELAGSQE